MTQEPLHLGALPPELFDKIFFEADTIRDLANFVVTARFVYHRFKAGRRTILFRVLKNELGPALPDARFLFVFPYSNPADKVRYYHWIMSWPACTGTCYQVMKDRACEAILAPLPLRS